MRESRFYPSEDRPPTSIYEALALSTSKFFRLTRLPRLRDFSQVLEPFSTYSPHDFIVSRNPHIIEFSLVELSSPVKGRARARIYHYFCPFLAGNLMDTPPLGLSKA